MDVAVINQRVDKALGDNRRAEFLIVGMAVALFLVGLLAFFLAYKLKNPYVASGSVLAQTFLVFPIKEVKKIRRDNLILQTFPSLILGLPPNKAATEISLLLKYLRTGAP